MLPLKTIAAVATLLVLQAVAPAAAEELPHVEGVAYDLNKASPIVCFQGEGCVKFSNAMEPARAEAAVAAAAAAQAQALAPTSHASSGVSLQFVCFGLCCTRCYDNGVRMRRLGDAGLIPTTTPTPTPTTNGTQIQCVPRVYGLECSPF